jgi:protein-L-isoaspartate O-methyltransferase
MLHFKFKKLKRENAKAIYFAYINIFVFVAFVFVVGDGRQGYADDAPYDAIHVGAAVEAIEDAMPVISQLKVGGRLVIPVGPKGDQQFTTVDKLEDGKIRKTKRLGVCYVPLTDVASQLVQKP